MTYMVKIIGSRLRNRVALLRQRDEGTIIMLGMMIAIFVLFFSGFAVDLMRTESQRVRLQSATDRAVLAAADVDQLRPRAEVVHDYMRAAGLEGAMDGEPVIGTGDAGEVSVNAKVRVDTIFARFADHLDVSAHSKAMNREAEISLVLDISGSMNWESRDENGYSTGRTKIKDLQDASGVFLDTLLTNDVRNRVSVSVVPYSEQVNLGEDLYGAFSNIGRSHSYSHCLDVPDAAYQRTSLARNESLKQVAHFNPYSSAYLPTYYSYYYGRYMADRDYYQYYASARSDLSGAPCPHESYNEVIALSQDKAFMKQQINKMKPLHGTAIYAGVKWGVALLDPDMSFLTQRLQARGNLDPAFRQRPYPYGSKARLKAVVLMTDGENSETSRVQDWAYDSTNDRQIWASTNMDYYAWYNNTNHWSQFLYTRYTKSTGDVLLDRICTAAKAKGIVIYGVAVQVTPSGEAPLKNCATSPAHFFSVSGGELVTTFRQIASDIKALRLME